MVCKLLAGPRCRWEQEGNHFNHSRIICGFHEGFYWIERNWKRKATFIVSSFLIFFLFLPTTDPRPFRRRRRLA